jgi:hypothetical protein
MIKTQEELADEIAWELTVLRFVLPVTPLSGFERKLDLRTKNIVIAFSDSMSDDASEQLKLALLPLLFGAAWKVLDISVELALANAACPPTKPGRWTIADKAREIHINGYLPAFSPSSDVWRALRSLYRTTIEPRHALVHRRVTVDAKTKELVCFDPAGRPLIAISPAEQSAFCRVAQRLATAATDGLIHPRAEADLRTQLAVLGRHHATKIQVPSTYRLPVKVVDEFPVDDTIDVPSLKERIRQTFPEDHYIDVELHLSNGRVLIGELDRAPDELAHLNLENLPPWLKFK